jgi:inward rectifier potassium channel
MVRRRKERWFGRTDDEVDVIGGPRAPFRDTYHAFLRARWWLAIGAIVASYLLLNVLFALIYYFVGGVANARPGSFADMFFFSVETMGTIGYGGMSPVSVAANTVMVAESVTGLLVTAVSTGMLFAKFSQSVSRIAFTHQAVISLMDGVPTLMFRVGNERANKIMEAQLRVVMMRTETTKEGHRFYRMYDLPLSRDRSPALSRSWTVLHPITEKSPLHGYTPASVKTDEVEVRVTLAGIDDTSLQPVHAQQVYTDQDIVFGARHVDILSETNEGRVVIDLRKFHEIAATEPTPEFPYPAES